MLRDAIVLAGLATVAVCAAVTGLVMVPVTASGPVIIVLVLASAPWLWRRVRRASRPASRVHEEKVPLRPEPNREVPGPHVAAADLSVAELCLAWRRSYLVLIETPYGAGTTRS